MYVFVIENKVVLCVLRQDPSHGRTTIRQEWPCGIALNWKPISPAPVVILMAELCLDLISGKPLSSHFSLSTLAAAKSCHQLQYTRLGMRLVESAFLQRLDTISSTQQALGSWVSMIDDVEKAT